VSTLTAAAAAGNGFGSNPLWFATRSTGFMTFVLLTAATALGIVATQRVATARWPRFASQALHRNVSLLAVLFLAVHVLTTLLDTYVTVSWWAAVVPFTSAYRTFDVGLGTLALDILLVVAGTSMMRGVTGHRWWRLVHWTAYAAWPLALAHYLGTGTDARTPWSVGLATFCLGTVLLAIFVRLGSERREGPTRLLGGAR